MDGITQITYHDYPKEPIVLDNLSVKFMKQSKFVPLKIERNALWIAMSNPEDFYTVDALRAAYGFDIGICSGKEEDIFEAIERLYGTGSQSLEMIIEEAGRDMFDVPSEGMNDIDHLRDLASEGPIIRLVNRLIVNAVEIRASDIHFEPFADEFKVRYRIDGILHDIESPPRRLQAAIISRIKIMAKLDIAERRLPQDGRIKLRILDKDIDFRISTIPTLFGEGLVMRILDSETMILKLKPLGFPEDILFEYDRLIALPYGMILVTGPTGSGKTSTLYATLAKINSSEKKIITLEEPIEYQLKGINQIQVSPKIGLTFANGLRTIVRLDPDIILVGEIRDKETAQIAVQSALTGHLLFSTLHTNDAAGAVTRLFDLGVESYLLGSTLLGVLAQRLVRVICPHCKMPVRPEKRFLDAIDLPSGEEVPRTFFEGKGCDDCRHTGFSGRTGIFEFLGVDDAIRREISLCAATERIKEAGLKKGMITLRQDGWRKACRGTTTISEVMRVTLEK